MKKLLLLTLFTLSFQFLYAQSPYLSKTFKDVENLEVESSGGSITLIGSGSNTTAVEVFVSGNGKNKLSQNEIDQRLENYHISLQQNGSTLMCKAESLKKVLSWQNSLNITFKVYAPSSINSSMSTAGGSINLEKLNGNHKFSTSGGELNIMEVDGNMKGSTSGGSIRVVASKSQMKLSTSGGSITAEDCEGMIKLSTSGGSITLENISGAIQASTSAGSIKGAFISGDIKASTSAGSVTMEHISGNISASSSAGSVELLIDEAGDSIAAYTSAGKIVLDMPDDLGMNLELTGNRVFVKDMSNFDGDYGKDYVKGNLNGGGTLVKAVTSMGAVRVL